ncbi:conserved protein of unknown function [Rhodovastum atsumiense]|uniref:DUF3293 domain-containing protein n=1 Tax=Rhodovastum atsumiense TaxID=504468 RepID=UPI00139F2B77|nr:DUF3293 domain-containing protein [Rhodovastum atsumiense]CAH2599510.1 conserved protein of unknown function [Rhodovastum atsumiense]
MTRFVATRSLRAAYEATAYVVFLRGRERVLRIGARPPALPWGVHRQAAFITAWNPFGRLRPARINDRAHRRLAADLRKAGLRSFPAEGRGDAGDWPPERSLLVFGCGGKAAAAWGRRLRQNAILWIVRERPVRLVALR